MKKTLRIILLFGFLFSFSQLLKASHGLPLVNTSYTIGATGVTIAGSSDAATCGSGPYWMQTKLTCDPSLFPNIPPDACLNSYLQNWAGPGTGFNSFPWFNSLLNVANYNAAAGWPDVCTVEAYNNVFIPFADLCPGKVYYFATREIVTGSNGIGPFGAVNSFTVPGGPLACTPGFISSNPVTSPSNPSCGGNVLLTISPPVTCKEKLTPIPGCSTCDSIVWWGPSGVVAVNTLTLMVSPLSTTTYTVGWDTCSSIRKVSCALCPFNKTITVYVANTNAAFAPLPTLCAGSNANFSAMFPALNDSWSVSPTTSVTPSSGTGPTFSTIFDDPGTFVVTHQAMNGSCMDVQSQTVTVTPGITTSITTTGGGCSPPSSTGSATVAVTSSTAGITYTWAPSGGNADNASGLAYNTTYSVTLSNGGCTVTKTLSIVNTVADGSFTTSNSAICSGSSITFNATATSTADSWSVTPTTSVTPSTSSSPTFVPVFNAVGTYTIIHQATNGACADTQTNTITVTAGIVSSISTTGGGCSGVGSTGSATVSVSTPTTGLTYSWSPSGGTSNIESNIPFNTNYSVTLSQGGCVITKTLVITNNPPPSITSFSVTSPLCNGQLNGTVIANLTGGNAPFSFTWSPTISQTTQTVTGVGAGTYSVFVLDNNGCSTSSVVTVTEPAVLTLTTSPSSTICSGTSTTLTASAGGGTSAYTYTWNPGGLDGSSPVVITPSASAQYTCSVTDANGCSITQTVDITVGLPITAAANSQSICASSGSVTLTPTITSMGNGGPYTYSWSPGGATTSSISVPANASPGSNTYTVTISDGCTMPSAVAIFTVVTTTAPVVSSFSVSQPLCNGQLTGTVSANLTGGTAPFSFTWSPTITQTTQTVTGVGAGTYSVFVSDNSGCVTASVVTVSDPAVLTLTTSASSTICSGNPANLNSTTGGGTGTITYTWNPGNINTAAIVVTPTANTTYTCTIKDANGCTQTQTTTITLKPALTVSATASAMCLGDSLVLTPTITSPGNGGPYSYSWNNGATTSTIMVHGTVATSTNYLVTVSDGCSTPSAVGVFTVSTNPPPVANIVADSLVGNAPFTVNFDDLGSGGSTFNWNFGNGSTSASQHPSSQTYQTGGTYQVIYTATSSSGCIARDTLSVLVIDLIPEITVPNVFTPNGDRANDWFAVTGVNITSFDCSIFNRWGKLVFSSSDIKNSWDGKINGNAADEGTYFYIIKASGTVGDDIKKQGYVSLFR